MKLKYPIKIVWRGFSFEVCGNDGRVWFKSMAESGDDEYMKELNGLLDGMVESVNEMSQDASISSNNGDSLAKAASNVAVVANIIDKPKFDRAAYMRKRWSER